MIVLQLAKALIEELDTLSRGTVPRRVPVGQILHEPQGGSRDALGTAGTAETAGTDGTTGTRDRESIAAAVSPLTRNALADLIATYEERLAMILEGGDISHAEAHRMATAECGATLAELRSRLAATASHHKASRLSCIVTQTTRQR